MANAKINIKKVAVIVKVVLKLLSSFVVYCFSLTDVKITKVLILNFAIRKI